MKQTWYNRIWTTKKYCDLWSTNHTLAGCVLSGVFLLANVSFLTSTIATFLILLSWEFFELICHIKEKVHNRIVDMTVGMLGFFITRQLMLKNISNDSLFLAIIVTAFLVMEILGALSCIRPHKKCR